MRHYKARQSTLTGKWKYTSAGRDGVYEVGYCSSLSLCPDCGDIGNFGTPQRQNCKKCLGSGLIDAENPCLGHDTPEEAEEHYKQYLLDRIDFQRPDHIKDQQLKCQICGKWTQSTVGPGMRFFVLCDEHLNRAAVSELLSVGESWES
jgi:hypothetical protein